MNHPHSYGCGCSACCDVDAYHESMAGSIETAIAAMTYGEIREQCDMFRRLNRLRGYRRREKFSAWLRERVEDQLIASDERTNREFF